VAALALALYVPEGFAHGGWLTGILLVGFALVLRAAALREEGRGA